MISNNVGLLTLWFSFSTPNMPLDLPSNCSQILNISHMHANLFLLTQVKLYMESAHCCISFGSEHIYKISTVKPMFHFITVMCSVLIINKGSNQFLICTAARILQWRKWILFLLTFSPCNEGTESRKLWKLSLMWSLRLRSSALWCARLSACQRRVTVLTFQFFTYMPFMPKKTCKIKHQGCHARAADLFSMWLWFNTEHNTHI